MKTAEFMEVSGLTQRQVAHWSEKGVLQPQGEAGQGNHREWDDAEVRVGKVLAALLFVGMSDLWVRQIVEIARLEHGPIVRAYAPGIELVVTP